MFIGMVVDLSISSFELISVVTQLQYSILYYKANFIPWKFSSCKN